MIRLEGKLFIGNRPVDCQVVKVDSPAAGFHKEITQALVELCATMKIPVPVWQRNNTAQFARFRMTFFSAEQFLEPVLFERFQIKALQIA
ncbi:MAG: hypothetical protein GX907_02190 [Clostridiaceae bacterium]|nr:hypothetical protein [Clostridiaceae bacterium]